MSQVTCPLMLNLKFTGGILNIWIKSEQMTSDRLCYFSYGSCVEGCPQVPVALAVPLFSIALLYFFSGYPLTSPELSYDENQSQYLAFRQIYRLQ